MSRLLDKLNPAQREAVTTTEGPLLIIAGAGSGKTRALTSRLAYILQERLAEPQNILAVTFTNKAAREMRDRVASLLGADIPALSISTFHSFCSRFLRIEAEALGYPKNFVIYDTEDSKALIKSCVEELGLSGAQFAAPALLRRISNAKNSLLTAAEFAEKADGYFETRTANVYLQYESRLRRSAAFDFDDLILQSVRLLRDHVNIREKYRRRFKYLMVDEYQDTNKSQYLLLRHLTGEHNNICVVGDEDQSIYGWRGADISNIRDFEKDFPGAKVVTLVENYRSTQLILDAAGAVIANNTQRKPKKLRANVDGGEKIKLLLTDNPEDEAAFVVEEISRLRDTISLNEIVTLYRTVAQSRAFENELIRRKLPYQIVGGVSFYQLKEIKDIIAYLKLISNERDDVSFQRTINYPRRGFGNASLQKLQALASAENKSLYQTAMDENLRAQVGARPAKILADYTALIESFRKRASDGMSIDLLVRELIDTAGIEKEILREAESEIKAQTRLENLDEFVASALEFTGKSADPSLDAFLEEISLYTSVDTYRDAAEKVTLMTIHAAKGLEFTAVFLSGLEEGLFPLGKALDDPNEMEEERRLFYVAATRAKQKLTFSTAQSRFRYGSTESAPSRFISETPEELMETIDHRTYRRDSYGSTRAVSNGASLWESGSATSRRTGGVTYEYEEEEVMRPGRIVQHRVFGRGKVLSVEGRGENMKIEVSFSGVGKKSLLAKFAKLQVVG